MIPLLLLSACTSRDLPEAVSVELSDAAPTVATVTWTTEAETIGHVEYGPDAGYGFTTPAEAAPTRDHSVDVVGLAPDEAWHYRAVSSVDGVEIAGDDDVIDIPSAPSNLPDFTLLAADGDAWGTYTLAAFGYGDTRTGGVVVLDPEGKTVWYRESEQHFVPWANMTPDERSVVFIDTDEKDPSTAEVTYVSLDGRSVATYPTPNAHHAIMQAPVPGVRFAYIAAVVGEWEGEAVVGDRIVEQADDGTEREVWNAWDQLPVEQTSGWDAGAYAEGADWTHANGLYYDADTDIYYLSLFYLSEVIAIDRTTGETLWQLGGTGSDFTFPNDRGPHHQHAPEVHGNDLYLFDNGSTDNPARGVEYELDLAAGTATRVWEWATPEGSHVGVLGDIDVLPDDQLLLGFGDLGQVDIVGRDGTAHLRVDADPGVIVGKAEQFETLYP